MDIEAATGWIWNVWYQWDGREIEQMIAVALTPEHALVEAHNSLSSGGDGYSIYGLSRDDRLSLKGL